MRLTNGSQQSDRWLKNRVGRITASRIVDVCSRLKRASGDKKPGDSSGTRDAYRRELISERLTGYTKDHFNSPAMQRGNDLEPDARMYYEGALRVMVLPVNFILHPQYDFTGATPDGLVGSEGMLEIKCLLPWNIIEVDEAKTIDPERFAQVGWQLACGGKERKWCDLVHYCPDIKGCDSLRFKYQRIGRDELEWTVGYGTTERKLTGEAAIDHFTAEVLKLNAEIEYYLAERNAKPVAPYPVELISEDGEVEEYGSEEEALAAAGEFMDRVEMTP